jgi:hypothetical protein
MGRSRELGTQDSEEFSGISPKIKKNVNSKNVVLILKKVIILMPTEHCPKKPEKGKNFE